jgi:hypothetical protein
MEFVTGPFPTSDKEGWMTNRIREALLVAACAMLIDRSRALNSPW